MKNNLQEKMLSELKWHLGWTRKAFHLHFAHLPELPEWIWEHAHISQTMGNFPDITLPYDRHIMAKVRAWAESIGWTYREDQSKGESEPGTEWPSMLFELSSVGGKYEHPRMIFRFNTTIPGAKCKRVQIGTVIEEKPVYDYVCDDAGAGA